MAQRERGQRSRLLVRATPRADLVLALLVVSVIAMMVVPLPTPLIDFLIALNLGFGVLLLAAALYMRDALGFAAFPTLLLLGTLYRLSLNVASTRLILLQADAGRVIEAFGSFVVRGDYRVGALVFVMLTLIQFIVIARGAELVAEVSARFSLDALPGKQLAIDNELRAGSLRPEEARAQRRRLERESQLYGALDGALKFVKGDAIAGIVITVINVVGGVSIGVFARDLPLTDSLKTYGLLTIGDGLVTQLPALLSATAAGLVVTRVAPHEPGDSLASDIGRTLLDEPRALAIGALVLFGLAFVPALPSWPFLLIALGCAVGCAAGMQRLRGVRSVEAAAAHHHGALVLELGRELYAKLCARGIPAPALNTALTDARWRCESMLGITLPKIAVRQSAALPPLALRWLFRELPSLVVTTADANESAACAASQLVELTRRRAADFLELDEVQRMIDRLEREQPALVRLTMPRPLKATQLAQVLRLLVGEGVSVRWLSEIVEAIAPHADEHASAHTLAEVARRALARRISHALAPDGALHVMRVSPELEETLSDGLRRDGTTEVVALPPDLTREIVEAIASAHRRAPVPHALVTTSELRRHVHAMMLEQAPDLAVVTAQELMPHLRLSAGELIGP
ncbi:MAG: Flagellar biosynthesis protein FlhA [Myxococcaceae bacterium]|nr:Flagellar biosynthesis protein FlhA [Myxococcaceae bacterium]